MAQEHLRLPGEVITRHYVQTWPDLPGFIVVEVHTGISHNPTTEDAPTDHAFHQLLIPTQDAKALGNALIAHAFHNS